MKISLRHLLLLCLLLCLALPLLAQGETTVPPAPPSTTPETPPTPTTDTTVTPPAPEPGSTTTLPPLPTPPETPPTTPPDLTTTPGQTAPLPPARPGTVPLRLRSSRVSFNQALGIYQFFGNVTLESPDFFIHADEMSYNDRTQLLLARGNVSIRVQQGNTANTYWGNLLEVNASTRLWHFLDASVQYPAGFLGPPFIAPVFINAQDIGELPDRYRASHATVTTCDLADPHYLIASRQVDIYPGDKLIARDNDLYVLGHRIIHIPWFFMTLRETRSPIVPEFGQNETEGYYGRFLYQYVFNPNELGGIRLDITSKLGLGLGVKHFYTLDHGSGDAFGYVRQGLKEYVATLNHTQQLPGQFRLTLTSDIRQNSLFTTQPTTTTNINTNLQGPNTRFLFTRRLNEGTFSADNITSSFTQHVRVARGDLNANANYSSYGGTIGTTRTLWNDITWRRLFSVGTVQLHMVQGNDLSDETVSSNVFSGVQRLPELTLDANQDQWGLTFLKKTLPSTFTLGWGDFDERSSGVSRRYDRSNLQWHAALQNILPSGSRTTLTGSTDFRQTVYGDPDMTALYTYRADLTAMTKFGSLQNVARYGKQDFRGFTPFAFDISYPYETATESLQYVTRTAKTYLNAGRDLENQRWQDLSLNTALQLSPRFATKQSVSYDLNQHLWRDLVSQFGWVSDSQLFKFSAGTRYDLDASKLRRVTTQLDWVIDPKWTVQWFGGYDGVNQKFLYNQFLVKRDLHCWDASIFISSDPQYIGLLVRLKALNIPLPQFGIGSGGQRLDTSLGAL